MKKTLILATALLCTSGFALSETAGTVTHHGVEFETLALNDSGEVEVGTADNNTKNVNITGLGWTKAGEDAKTLEGICIESKSPSAEKLALKFNYSDADNPTVTHLYLAPTISIASTGSGGGVVDNTVGWNGSDQNHKVILSGTAGAWVDVDTVYNNIDLAQMSSGTVYLNQHGQIQNSVLSSGNTVVAEANLSLDDIAATPALYSKQVVGDNLFLVTRTLLTGNYEGWTGTVILSDGTETQTGNTVTSNAWMTEYVDASDAMKAGNYSSLTAENIGSRYVIADSTGLKVAYLIPEPATATLSLLALAGLAARRRRK